MRIKLDVPLNAYEIAKATGGSCKSGWGEKLINYLSTDSRELSSCDLFVPLKGERFDGETFIEDANRLSALTVSKSHPNAIIKAASDDILLSVADYYKRKKLSVRKTVAITGSVGKTTTKEFLKEICSLEYKTHATEGNLNNTVGLPLTVLSAPSKTEILICELGMNSRGEISRLSKTLKPDIAVITNVGTAHIGNLGSRKNIAEAKLEILDGMTEKFLIAQEEESLLSHYKSRSFSVKNTNADVFLYREGGEVCVAENGKNVIRAEFSPVGEHNLECLAAATCAALSVGIDKRTVKRGFSLISNNNIRQRFVNVGDIKIINDSYNASRESISADLKLLSELSGGACISAVLGSVLELGDYSESIHREIGVLAARAGLSSLFAIGRFARDIAFGAMSVGFPQERIYLFEDTSSLSAVAYKIRELCKGELILIKGSHKLLLSRIIDELKKLYGE